MPAGLALLDELRTREERATGIALSALGLLLQREQLAEIDRMQPGCQWGLALTQGFLPPPTCTFTSPRSRMRRCVPRRCQ